VRREFLAFTDAGSCMSRYRVREVLTADGVRFIPEVQGLRLCPWARISERGYTVEWCDYGGEKTYEAAVENCRKHATLRADRPKIRYLDFSHYA
jgi:hypothetical protein